MIDKFLTLLENPLVVIAITVIVLVVLLTQKTLVGKVLRKYLKLNTDLETIEFHTKFNGSKLSENDKIVRLEQFKNELIGGRPDDR